MSATSLLELSDCPMTRVDHSSFVKMGLSEICAAPNCEAMQLYLAADEDQISGVLIRQPGGTDQQPPPSASILLSHQAPCMRNDDEKSSTDEQFRIEIPVSGIRSESVFLEDSVAQAQHVQVAQHAVVGMAGSALGVMLRPNGERLQDRALSNRTSGGEIIRNRLLDN